MSLMQTVNRSFSRSKTTLTAGIRLMLFGCLLFSLNDALGKWLVTTYSVGHLLLIRSLAVFAVLVPFAYREGWKPFATMPRPGLQVLRVALSSVEIFFFFWAVSYLPLADVTTFYLAGPIFVTAISPFLLGETIGWKRWAAVIAGFVGVVIAMQPSFETVSLPALIALAGSFCFACLMMVTRKVRGTSDVVLLSTQVIGTLSVGAIAAPFDWVMPSARDVVLMGLVGLVGMLGIICVNRSLK